VRRFLWTDHARAQLRRIDREHAIQILRALTDFANTGKGQLKSLKGSGDLRLRVGDYRIRFEKAGEHDYRILGVHHRREAYR
jgi:mRNA-degrading endonuclease RelE of RelBE toxin-antitoxin system